MTGRRHQRSTAAWAVLALVILALGGGLAVGRLRPGRTQGAEQTSEAARRDMTTFVRATGVVKPKVGAEVRVGSRVSGIVERLHVRIGDSVRAGQLLAELDSVEWEARRDQAAALLETARTNLRYAEVEAGRKRGLSDEGLVPRAERDAADHAVDVARARTAEAEANLRALEIQRGYTRITAPISGVVATVTTQEGETVSAGLVAPTFVTIIDLERLEVRAYVDETDIGRVHRGQHCTFTVDTYPGTEFQGRVTAIYPSAEIQDNVVNYLVIIEMADRRDHAIRPEMTTSVSIALETRRAVLAVPRGAVSTEGGRKYVYLPTPAGHERREVATGWRDERQIEIVRGLNEGERVLTEVPSTATSPDTRPGPGGDR